MSIFSRLRLFYLCYLSRPRADRPAYRAIRHSSARKIVELGVGNTRRAMRMIEIARSRSAAETIHYVGMDLFEGRSESDGPSISLKEAHQRLRATGVRVQLVPGNPSDSLIRLANSLGKVDLLIVPEAIDTSAMARVWFFVPRILHERTIVFVEGTSEDGRKTLRRKSRDEIDFLAAGGATRRAA